MRRPVIVLIALAAVALAAAAVWVSLRAPAVPAIVVEAQPLVRSLLFSARVASASRVDVGATLTGRVESVSVLEGARVQRGETLLQLESSELRAALEQASASEAQAAARLAGLKSTGRSAAAAGVAQADSVLRAAQAELQRTRDLVASGFLSEARMDEVSRVLAVAQAQRDAAVAQRQANDGTDLAQAQAQLALAQAARAAARARLEQATLAAPANARVLVRSVEPGQIVQPGRALLTLALDSALQLVGQVDERYLAQLKVGQAASVRADAFPQQRFDASVFSIAPVVDAQRGAIEVKLVLTQATPPFLREDMTLTVEVVTGRRERALVVPTSALSGERDEGATASVRVARDGRAELRQVRLGLSTLDSAEVVDGLSAGDVVLLGPALAPGSRVRADTGAAAALRAAGPQKVSSPDVGSAMSNGMGR